MYVVICKIDHCIHIHWCIVMGLGHNDPWVESHMWPQQTWGQRSSRGQWPLVHVFGKKGQCIHILWCIFKSIKYYNDCKSMWSRKQARLVVREPPCLICVCGPKGKKKKKKKTSAKFGVLKNWFFVQFEAFETETWPNVRHKNWTFLQFWAFESKFSRNLWFQANVGSWGT